ncbi:MAG: hypothetical protein LBG58_12730 [Planctomycetaceae bacterium]|jgi:hypothetical protein|nr:hypothetical protein [Planctomycetaceae bacterium]
MPKQTVLSCQRENDTLILKLKCDTQNDPSIIVVAIIMLVSFGCFYSGIHHGCNSSIDCFFMSLFLLFIIAGGLFIVRTLTRIQTLCYDAEFLHVEDEYPYITWKPKQVFGHNQSILSVARVFSASGKLDANFRWQKNFRYETWIPFGATGRRGTICVHESEEKMHELENEFQKFRTEILCRKKLRNETTRMETFKDYSIDRGENFPMKEDSKTKKPFTVTYNMEDNINNNNKTLIIVSEKGGSFSRLIARCSSFLIGAVSIILFIGFLSLFGLTWYYYYQSTTLDPYVIAFLQGDYWHKEILPKIVPQSMMDTVQKSIDDLIQSEPIVRILVGFFVLFCAFFLIYGSILFLLGLIRWPFWKCWTIRLEHSKKQHHRLTYNWQTDRLRVNLKTYLTPFFKVIPATSKTNRIITGRSFFDFNHGWKQPFQVVILTIDHSIPFPVTNPEEQEKMIQILDEFVARVRHKSTDNELS